MCKCAYFHEAKPSRHHNSQARLHVLERHVATRAPVRSPAPVCALTDKPFAISERDYLSPWRNEEVDVAGYARWCRSCRWAWPGSPNRRWRVAVIQPHTERRVLSYFYFIGN